MMIDKKTFMQHMNDVVDLMEYVDKIYEVSAAYNKKSKEEASIYFPSLVDNVSGLLEILTNDKSEMISYWLFELDMGKKYHDGCVADANGDPIPLKTLDDLWTYLISEE